VNQTSGTVSNQGGSFYLGRDEGAGYYNLSGGLFNPGQTAYIGRNGGYGEVSITGSGQFVFDQEDIGLRVGTISDASLSAVGVIIQNGEDTSVVIDTSARVIFGQNQGAVGVYELHEGTLTVDIYKDFATGVHFGEQSGASGQFFQFGGTSTFLSTLTTFGNGGYGFISIQGGVSHHEIGILLGNLATGEGVIQLTGGVLEIGGTNGIRTGEGSGHIEFGNGTLRAISNFTTSVDITAMDNTTATIDSNSFNVTLDSLISGNGNIRKTGEGTLFLTAQNTSTPAQRMCWKGY